MRDLVWIDEGANLNTVKAKEVWAGLKVKVPFDSCIFQQIDCYNSSYLRMNTKGDHFVGTVKATSHGMIDKNNFVAVYLSYKDDVRFRAILPESFEFQVAQ